MIKESAGAVHQFGVAGETEEALLVQVLVLAQSRQSCDDQNWALEHRHTTQRNTRITRNTQGPC
jgi:hypothetical protein